MGRITKNPELRYINTGKAVINFTLAVDRQLSKEQEEEYRNKNIPTTDFIQCQAWGKNAENIMKFTSKGKRLIVSGRIQTASYIGQDGARKYITNVSVSSIEFIDWNEESKVNMKEEEEQYDFIYEAQENPMDDDRIPF